MLFHRSRSSDLLNDELSLTHPQIMMNHGDMTLNSISYAIGSSELQQQKQTHKYRQSNKSKKNTTPTDPTSDILHDGGSVEPSSSAVIANYFLKSHGGLHGIQSTMSILSVLFGFGSFAVPASKNLTLKIRLIQRTLLCALSKHLSGFIAAATASASQIPDIGWRETKLRIESFALDPVAQYLFYCALLVLWTNGVSTSKLQIPNKVLASDAAAAGAASNVATAVSTSVIIPWWLKGSRNIYCVICILGPILLREIISTIWVISDVLILYHSSKIESTNPPILLKMGKNVIDAFMSILLTPSQWRGSNPAMKQKLLAKLVARISLGLEIGTGLILIMDAIRAFLDFSISSVDTRPSIVAVGKRLLCARLYINFMIVRRSKVNDLVHNLRGGFMYVPVRVLDTLLEPQKAMGLNWGVIEKRNNDNDDGDSVGTPSSWKEWVGILTGF